MSIFLFITLAALLTGVLSLIGGGFLLYKHNYQWINLRYLVSFAAGALLTTALLDLLPEALNDGQLSYDGVMGLVLVGIIFFFLTEKFLLWHHHSHDHGDKIKPSATIIIVGDTLHNFLDGPVIAAAFLVSVPLGIVTTIAIILHEIPQEVGDFAVLLDSGLSRYRVLLYNLLSSLATLIGAWLGYWFSTAVALATPILLALAAASFIYIGAADLIPEIHRETNKKYMVYQALCLLLGVVLIWLVVNYLEH